MSGYISIFYKSKENYLTFKSLDFKKFCLSRYKVKQSKYFKILICNQIVLFCNLPVTLAIDFIMSQFHGCVLNPISILVFACFYVLKLIL